MTNMASSLAEIAPADASVFLYKGADETRKLIRLLHLDAMPGRAHELEPRLGEQGGVAFAGTPGHNLVVVTPDDECRSTHSPQQLRQALIVHVGFPGDPEAHLAAQIPFD